MKNVEKNVGNGVKEIMRYFLECMKKLEPNGPLLLKVWGISNNGVIFRSENAIKNKFYNCLRKFVRRLNYKIK